MSCQLFPNQWIFNVQSYKLIPIESFTNNKVQNVNLKWEIQGSYIHFIANKDMKLSNGYKNKTNERSNKSKWCQLLLMWLLLAGGWQHQLSYYLPQPHLKGCNFSSQQSLDCSASTICRRQWLGSSSRPPLAGTISSGHIQADCTSRQQYLHICWTLSQTGTD